MGKLKLSQKDFLIIAVIIISFAAVLRFYELDLRPYHHDESVHAHFSYKLLDEGYYEGYNPVWHGPFLYYITALMFRIFTDSNLVGRFLPALIGVLLVALPLFIRKYIGDIGALFAAFFLAISPSFLYYSRFLRLDIFMAFFSFGMIIGLLYFLKTKKYYFLCISALLFALSLTAMESVYVNSFIFLVFCILFLRSETKKFIKKAGIRNIFVSLSIIAIVYYLFYSFFLQYPLDPFFAVQKAVTHWSSYNQGPSGPPYFYLGLAALYEIPILVFGLAAVFSILLKRPKKKQKFSLFPLLVDYCKFYFICHCV